MNTWTDMEQQMRSWKPRPPTQSLKTRLFGSTHKPCAEMSRSLRGLGDWWAPAIGCALTLMVVMAGRLSEPLYLHSGGTILAAAVRGDAQNLAAYLAPEWHSDQNGLPNANLESTNGLLLPFK